MTNNTITLRNHERLSSAYDWFNGRLFGGGLPPCLITFQRRRRVRGYFLRQAYSARRGKSQTDEIALNPSTFPGRTDGDVMSTLVHEMAHLWQAHFGRPGRRGYHNREWAAKMESVGLRPTATGKPGGKKTGESVTHYVIDGGPFEVAWGELYRTGFRLDWQAAPYRKTDRNKVKYTCPGCGVSVWGKPGLENLLLCVGCKELFVAQTAILESDDTEGV